MRIIVDNTEGQSGIPPVIAIDSAKYLSDYAIRVHFTDGSEKVIDFKPFLSKSLHPSIKKYFNENTFSRFSIADGNLNWNDYELIFPIWELYDGEIRT